jgi:hypothetical protein
MSHLGPQWNAARSTHHRVAWLTRESSKPGRERIERWTLQASPSWSEEHLRDDSGRIEQKLLRAFSEITGIRAEPSFARTRCWPEAQTQVPLGQTHLWDGKVRVGVAGDSAGANLVAVAAQRVAGAVPLRAAGLIYPAVQHFGAPSASCQANEGKFLTAGVMQWFSACYLGDRPGAAQDPDFALLRSTRLHTLPPTWLATMGHDPLRDEGHALALRIAQSGVDCTHKDYAGALHGCIHFTAVSPLGGQVMQDLAEWLHGRL